MTVTLNAPAKINLSVDIISKRPDGYHEVRMVMQTIDLHDILVMSESDDITLTMEGEGRMADVVSSLPSDAGNLCIKAAECYKTEAAKSGIPFNGMSIKLNKNIPMGAGLGGGSSDAAAVLRGADIISRRLYGKGFDDDKLARMALGIGADVPYCLTGGTKLAEGLGEKLTKIPDMPDCHILIAKPDESASTAEIYGLYDACEDSFHPDILAQADAVKRGDLADICKYTANTLTEVTVSKIPVIGELKQVMVENGALCSEMTGSGSAVFGIFDDQQALERAYNALKAGFPDVFTAKTRPVCEFDKGRYL